MRSHKTILFFFAIFAVFCLTVKADPNTAAKPKEDPVVVTVNGIEITESQILADIQPQIDRMLKQAQERKVPAKVIEDYRKQFMQQAIIGKINEILLDAAVKKNKITVDEKEVTQELEKMASQQNLSIKDFKELVKAFGEDFDQLKERTRKMALYDKLMAVKFADETKVTEAEVKDFYKNNMTRFSAREQVRASHILIKPDTSEPGVSADEAKIKAKLKAEALLRKIKAGDDFAKLAMENSTCPSAQKGGDLGFFNHGDMVPPFEKAAFSLKPGEVSGVVETQFGYHIIKTTEHKPSKVTTFEEAKGKITEQLKQRKLAEYINKYIESLRTAANIVYSQAKQKIAKHLRRSNRPLLVD